MKMRLPSLQEVENEVYCFMHLEFPIKKAIEHLKNNPRETQELNPEDWIKGMSHLIIDGKPVYKNLDEVEAKKKSFTMGTNVDWKYARNMDEERAELPVLFVSWEADGEIGGMLIDGHHRVAHKFLKGKDRMEAYVLDVEESKELFPEPMKILGRDKDQIKQTT